MMVNLKQKESVSEDSSINDASTSTVEGKELKKTCKDCHTTKTPLWRGGPAGPRSLCNACGIRYRKSRRALLGVSTTDGADKFKRKRSTSKGNSKIDNLELQWMEFGRDIFSQRSARIEKHMRNFGEEEQAAFLLMALSMRNQKQKQTIFVSTLVLLS